MSGLEQNTTVASAVRRIEDLAGPRGLPLLGNMFQFDGERIHLQAEKWAREYGDVFRFNIGPRRFVVMSNPQAVASILRDRPDGFQRSQRLEDTANELGFGGLFSSNGAAWKRQRSMVLAGLDPTHIKSFFPTLANVTARLAKRWRLAASANQPIDLQADLMRYTVDVTAGLAFGKDINTLESDQEVIQTHLDKILPALFKRLFAPIQYWHYVKLPSDRALDRHLIALREAISGFIADARQRLAERPELREHPTNLIEAMVVARDRDNTGITDEDVSGNVLTMLLAGEDTTANTLAWMIWLLQQNLQATQLLSQEVCAIGGAHGMPQRYEDLTQLDYLEACANETMRIKPVAPINVQQAVRDTVVAGTLLPAGTLVMCLMRPAAVDNHNFADATSFLPQRWMSGLSASSSKRVAMPFGAGPRVCPGRYLALAEIKMVIAMLYASFEVKAVTTPDGGDAQERLALTMAPMGLQMRLRARSA